MSNARGEPSNSSHIFVSRPIWLPFKDSTELSDGRAFLEGTRFEDVVGLYFFDRELRLWCWAPSRFSKLQSTSYGYNA